MPSRSESHAIENRVTSPWVPAAGVAVRGRPHYRPLVYDPALSSSKNPRSYIRLFSGGVVGYSWVMEAMKSDMDSK